MGRTFVIGDVHGERAMLDRVLAKLPFIAPDDTLVLLGDYLDRGPDSRGVVERVRRLPEQTAGKVVTLRGNHEDMYLRCLTGEPDAGFLLVRNNGVAEAFRSFTDREVVLGAPLADTELVAMLDLPAWVPPPIARWLHTLPLWYEDEHAIYVHAGLDGEGDTWLHPKDGRPEPLLWMREPDFFAQYAGKQLVFGHTPVSELPPHDADRREVWRRGPLIGLDTGAGCGGFVSAIELPSGRVYDGRE